MNRKVLLTLVAAIFLLSFVLVGCQEGGIAQELYDQVRDQIEDIQSDYTEVQDVAEKLQEAKAEIEDQYEAAQTEVNELLGQVDELLGQVKDLTGQYVLEGATLAETAANIIRYYHDTHVYDVYDMFVCADMAAEVWNMLKAQGISSTIVVGDINNPINNIIQSNHSWVLAEIAPGEYLALETTGGRVVLESENPLYYRGWTYDTPAKAKEHQKLIREYNVRVGIRNELAAEEREVVAQYNQSTNQQTRDELLAVRDKLVELIEQHESVLLGIKAEMESLATKCGT